MPFKKGHTINIGRKLSEETRKRMSKSHQGLVPSSWGAGFSRGAEPWNKRGSIARNAYFAALLDGEGSVFITNNGKGEGIKYKKICVSFGMRADKSSPLDEGYSIWGGSLQFREPRKSNHNQVKTWTLWTKDAEKFLRSVLPFLKIKKEQSEIVLEYRKLQARGRPFHQPISEYELRIRKNLYDKLKLLNQ